jgi:CubicO group peptidase (beta-lactamase class C family)
MRGKYRMRLGALSTAAMLLLAASAAAKPPAEKAFDEWLAAFNSNDKAAISAFNERRFGEANHNIDYLLDSREETGGLEVVRVERSEPTIFVALTQERNFPAYRRITVKVDKPGSPVLDYVTQEPQRMPQAQALKAFDAFATRMAAADRFSGVLVVEQNGKRLYGKHFGLADRENNTPVRLDTPFLFASQGKMFTAVSVLQLIEAGKLGFDDPIGKYLTDYPNKEMAKVTVRQLLSHQGGTGDIGVLQPNEGLNRAWARTIGDLIKLNGDRAPAFPPGSRFEYSNYGFLLLGALVEKVSGQNYYAYVAEHVFGPAGMTATSFPTLEQIACVARGYTQDNDGRLMPSTDQLPWRGSPAGGGVATADDEVRFVEALKAGKLISLPMLTEAIKQQTDWYGYGFISSGPTEFPHWGHGGGARGNSAALSVYPSNNMTMVCLSNRDPPVCDRLLTRLHFHLSPPPPAEAEAAAN